MDVYDLVCETDHGTRIHLRDDHAADFLDEHFEAILGFDDVAELQINAHTEDKDCKYCTTHMPLAWVNRLVHVELDAGEVVGMLSDESLHDCAHAHLTALPGSPAIAPLPMKNIRGVKLVDKALHVSFCRSEDGQVNVWRWLHQEGDGIWLRELHMDSWAERTVDPGQYVISDALKFHLWYESGSESVRFSRFPAYDPSSGEPGAAHLPEWRTQWRNPSMHIVGRSTSEEYAHLFERNLETLTDDVARAWDSCPDEARGSSGTATSMYS